MGEDAFPSALVHMGEDASPYPLSELGGLLQT
jgi:hypothetical protein